MRGLISLLRPRQWIKNFFVFAPLLFSGHFLNGDSIKFSLLAFLYFCIASSASYIINDIKDIENDRMHPKKSKSRPLAAGLISIRSAVILLIVLFSIMISALLIMPQVLMVISAYLLLNIAYSFVLKNLPVVDIFTISMGFVLRVYAGAIAIDVPLSSWMLITTLSLALYLSAIKRRQELIQWGVDGRKVLKRYSFSLLERYAEISATGALIFYSLFVLSHKPKLILTIPLVLFGLFRYWYVVEVLNSEESPSDLLLSDWQLLLTVLLWVITCTLILWP